MTKTEAIDRLIRTGDRHWFYSSRKWRAVRDEVLRMDRHECQICKQQGRYSRAEIVHHINHSDECPEMALDIYAPDGERNLISVCKKCHETICHPEKSEKFKRPGHMALTLERWD